MEGRGGVGEQEAVEGGVENEVGEGGGEESQLCVRDFCLSKFRAVRIDCVRGSGFMGKYFVLKPTLASSGGWREMLQYNTHSIDV